MQIRMDWRAADFDWNRARAFLAVAEAGSLSAAARAMGMTQPTVGRQIAALERELGVALFERGPRGLALTPGGADLVEPVRGMFESATQLALTASGRSQTVEGTVCVSASETVAAFELPALLAPLAGIAPRLEIEIVASNAISDLRRREADIAVRNVRPTQRELVARKVKEIPAWLYATPDLIERLGAPAAPVDLANAPFVGFQSSDRLMDGLNVRGFSLTPANFRRRSESELVRWEMVKQGLGIGVFTEDIGDREPLVRRVLPNMEPIMVPVWLTAHREVRTSRRVRLVYDLLLEGLAG